MGEEQEEIASAVANRMTKQAAREERARAGMCVLSLIVHSGTRCFFALMVFLIDLPISQAAADEASQS